jgi:hypothetical protein
MAINRMPRFRRVDEAELRVTRIGMTHGINIQHWLDEHGQPAAAVRRGALRVARLIEYGGPLEVGQIRATLVECSRRVKRRACSGLLWVGKLDTGTIEAYCLGCQREHLLISGWEETEWADGPMEPVRTDEPMDSRSADDRATSTLN